MATSSTKLSASGRILGADQIHVEERTLRTQLQKAGAVLKDLGYELWKSKLATCGAAIVLVMLFTALFADVIHRYDPLNMTDKALAPPSWEHWFGTDPYGRDIWSRVIHGARRAMAISTSAVLLGLILGVPLGAISGYYSTLTVNLRKFSFQLP